MLDRNHSLNDGHHDEDLLSYIYGEMDEHARGAFEFHLERCDECAVELGAMSDARLGVVEWRRNDFDHLATPNIFVPQSENAAVTVAATEKTGFFAGLAELVSSASVFAKAGVGLAAAALLIGVIYFSFVPRQTGPDVANERPKVEAPTPDASVKTPNSAMQQEVTVAKDPNVKPVDEPIRVGEHSAKPSKLAGPSSQVAANHLKNRTVNRLNSETAKMAPRLNSFDDDEDQTLRLSDLFSQVGPVKR